MKIHLLECFISEPYCYPFASCSVKINLLECFISKPYCFPLSGVIILNFSRINLTFWDELAHVASQHVEKGQQIYISGRLVSDVVESDDGQQQTYYKVLFIAFTSFILL